MNPGNRLWEMCTIDWAALGIWVGAAMELCVALVILYEIEQHRRSSFLEEASSEQLFKDRQDIYKVFLEAEGTTVEAKSEAFCESLWHNHELRTKCDRQLVLFNKLGYLLAPPPISWIVSNESILQWFPQSVAILWLILTPYITERRKKNGQWWAKQFSDYTAASVSFLLRNGVQILEMFHPDRSDFPGLTIGKDQLQAIQRQLRRNGR